LRQHFGFDDFREGQREVVGSILEGKDAVVVMPTGSGKSLCYQLPAMILDGVTLVVSPLIALMKDQVDALQARGLPATFINSSLSERNNARASSRCGARRTSSSTSRPNVFAAADSLRQYSQFPSLSSPWTRRTAFRRGAMTSDPTISASSTSFNRSDEFKPSR
jgi:ATP-dependent DNA helicase RecQ